MGLGTILLIVVILALIGVLPVWPHASSWGYGPTGIVGVVIDFDRPVRHGAPVIAPRVGGASHSKEMA